jgi:hypothetical protein
MLHSNVAEVYFSYLIAAIETTRNINGNLAISQTRLRVNNEFCFLPAP